MPALKRRASFFSLPDTVESARVLRLLGLFGAGVLALACGVARADARPTCWPDFFKRMRQLADRTGAAAKVPGARLASADILDVLTCKGRHDVYRADKHKKKPDGPFEP